MSLLNEENWRGKGNYEILRKKRLAKYLVSCSEIKKIFNKSKLRSNKIVSMTNGSISTPLKKRNRILIVNNTCAFDTTLSVICIGYYDFSKYQNY